MASRFKYSGTRDVEGVTRRSKESGGSYDSYLSQEASFFKVGEGENAVRILPPTWAMDFREELAKGIDAGLSREKASAAAAKKYPDQAKEFEKWGDGWEIQVWLHRNVGPDNGTYLCLDKMQGERCPVCEAQRDATDEDEANSLKVGKRPMCYVIDRNNEKAGPQILSMPLTLFREINTRSIDKKDGSAILIDDPEEGFDVLFTREGKDLRTKYTGVEVERDPTPIHEDQKKQDKWLDYITANPLPDLLQFYPADHIEKVLFGRTERRRSEAAEEEDRPSRRSRRGAETEEDSSEERSSRRSSRIRSEPEDDTEEDRPRRGRREEPAEEDSEETPRRGRRGREEPAEDEEADRPSRSSSRGKRGGDEEEDQPEERSSRRSRRDAEEPAEEDSEAEEAAEDTGRRGRRGSRDAAEDEDAPRGGRVERRRMAAPKDEAEDEEDPSGQARRKLERLGRRR